MNKIQLKNVVNSKVNLIFAIIIAVLPLINSFMDLVGIQSNILFYLLIWTIIYGIIFLISISVKALHSQVVKINFNFFSIIILSMLVWMLIGSFVNGFSPDTIMYIALFLVCLCFFSLDEKYSYITKILLTTIAICCIMGFIDPFNAFMPGFPHTSYPLSLHFMNPNYSASITSCTAIYCFLHLSNDCFESKKHPLKDVWFYFYAILFLIFTVYLFLNGSFVPISALVLAEIFSIIFFSIKHKKINWIFITFLACTIAICFLVDLVPNIKVIRTCNYNYFLECIAVVDNVLGTKILKLFGIEKIVGADGWDRNELMKRAFEHVTSSPKNFIFGCGAGTFNTFRPHNVFLSLWLDFGVLIPTLYSAFFIGLFVKQLRSPYSVSNTKSSIVVYTFLVSILVSSLVFFSNYIFMVFLAEHLKTTPNSENSIPITTSLGSSQAPLNSSSENNATTSPADSK